MARNRYLFEQETVMIKNCSSQNEFAIININIESRKLFFWLLLSEKCWKKQQTCSYWGTFILYVSCSLFICVYVYGSHSLSLPHSFIHSFFFFLSFFHFSVYLSTCLLVCFAVSLVHSIFLSLFLFVSDSWTHCLPVFRSFCLSIFPLRCLILSWSICLSVYLWLSLVIHYQSSSSPTSPTLPSTTAYIYGPLIPHVCTHKDVNYCISSRKICKWLAANVIWNRSTASLPTERLFKNNWSVHTLPMIISNGFAKFRDMLSKTGKAISSQKI